MKKLTLLAILFVTPALAEDAVTPTPVNAPAEAKPTLPGHLTLDLDQTDLGVLNQCIGELPYKVANPFVQKINSKLQPAK